MALLAVQSRGKAGVLALVLAVVFGVPVLLLVRALPRIVAERFVVFGAEGMRFVHGKDEVLLTWPQIAAVGVSYRGPAGPEVGGRGKPALEVFPVAPEAAVAVAKLLPFWKQSPPPVPSLLWWRWTFPLPVPLPPGSGAGQGLADGVRALQPGRWLGWFARPKDSGVVGYSGTPLARKLGLKAGHRLVLWDAPRGWAVPDVRRGWSWSRGWVWPMW